MSVFAWRRRNTRHFGEQWVPFAEVHLKSRSGRWYTFSVQVDTGAVISVVSRSVGELLGHPAADGERIELAGVDAPARRYFVQQIPTRIGDMSEFQMRVAVAEHEDVPNLLGRLDVLDRHQIDFDASLEETRLTFPWLDAHLRRIWRQLMETEATILDRWLEHPLPAGVDEAAKRFVNRADQLVAAGTGFLKLHRQFELPLIIRSLFELSVQFEYLMGDAEPRAELYLEYAHVTKHRKTQAWRDLPGPIGEHLRASSLRLEGEKRNLAEYNRVKSKFPMPKKQNQVRRHWYPGTLRDLASEVGRTAEYDAVYGLYSAWAHGDPWTSDDLELGHGGLMELCFNWARILILIANEKKIILSGDAYRVLESLAKGFTTD